MTEGNLARTGRRGPSDAPLLARDARLYWIAIIGGTLLALVVSYLIAIRWLYLGNGSAGWVYRYVQEVDFRPHSLVIVLIVTLLTLPLLALTRTVNTRREWQVVVLCLLVALAVQALLRSLTPFTFEEMFVSDSANGYYGVTRRLFASTILAEFERVRPSFPSHVEFNMPGKILLISALKYLSRSPAILAWLVVVVSNLGGLFCYLFVRDLFEDRKVALFSLILYLLTPAKLLFFPLLNTVSPVPVMLCAYLLLRSLRTGRAIYPLLMGAALYGLVLFEPLPLVMGLMFAAIGGAAVLQGDTSLTTAFRQFGLVVVGFAVTYAAMVSRARFDLFDAFRQVWIDGTTFNRATGRPYGIWVRQNLLDFVFGLGLCQAAAFCAALWVGLSGPDGWGRRFGRPIVLVSVSLLVILLITDLIGIHRGEVTREWIFLACFFQIPAAYVCAKLDNRAAIALVATTSLLQVALGTSMIGFIVPN